MILSRSRASVDFHFLGIGIDRRFAGGAGFPEFFEFFETIEAGANGAEIGERAAEPALGDVVHATALGFFFDGMPGLALGADEEDIRAAGDGLLDELLGAKKSLEGFLHIDDVNHVALAVNVRRHLRIPARNAMSEMDAGVHQRFDQIPPATVP